jgi:putative ABC transport system permease protein
VLANAGLRLLGGDLGGGYFSDSTPELIFAPGAALSFFLLGILAALLGSWIPARDAARAQPAIALKDAGDVQVSRSLAAPAMAFSLLLAGGLLALLPPVGPLPLFGYASIALMLAGGIAAMPMLARLLLFPLQGFAFRIPVHLASKHLWGAPSQAAIALCGIVASTSLTIAMATMVTSFRGSVDDWLVQILPADLYIRADGEDAFTADIQQALAAIPGVGEIRFRKITPLRLSPEQPPVAWIAQRVSREAPEESLPLIGASLPVPDGAIPVYLSEPAMWIYNRRAGEFISLPVAVGPAAESPSRFFVAGIWRDYGRQQGTVTMDEADYTRLTGDTLRTEASVVLVAGAEQDVVVEGLRAALPPELRNRVSFAPSRELRAMSLRIFDRSFAVTYVLEAIAILVGLAGVAATFSAQTFARAREFGMLRHIGVLRRQIVEMLAVEGALLGTVGVIAGIGLGLAISQVLIHVINPQSFHWTMETRLPLPLFASVTLALIGAAAGTALLAGRRALSADAVRAVREDW